MERLEHEKSGYFPTAPRTCMYLVHGSLWLLWAENEVKFDIHTSSADDKLMIFLFYFAVDRL